MSKPKVLVVPHTRKINRIFAPEDWERLHAAAEVVWGRDDPIPPAEFGAALPEVAAIVHGEWTYGGAETLKQAPHLKAVLEVMGAHSHPGFDYDYCFDHRIRVLSCAPAFALQVAEMALGMALDCARDIVRGDRLFRAGEEQYSSAGNAGTFLLSGQTVGFVGFGSIARKLKDLLAPFSCRLLAYDPWLPASSLRTHECEPVELARLLSEARVIFVMAVPTLENKAMLNRELLERIAPGSVLVLISRAHVVDFDALTDLVLQGRFKAAIDVFPVEPAPADLPIRRAEHAVLSAHRAGSVREGLLEIGRMVVDDLEAILAGLPPQRMQAAQPELVHKLDPAGERVSASYRARGI
jgi:phosphoglycerate dehydrogenase-like enzyme